MTFICEVPQPSYTWFLQYNQMDLSSYNTTSELQFT